MQEQEFEIPSNIVDIQDLSAEIYIQISESKNGAEKKELIAKYNQLAKAGNKITGKATFIIIGKAAPKSAAPSKAEKQASLKVVKKITPVVSKKVPEIKAGGKIAEILGHHKKGLSNKEIVELGFNKSTVNRQVSEYKKANPNGKLKTK